MQQCDIFVSYDDADKTIAEEIITELEANGITIGNRFEERSAGNFSRFLGIASLNLDEMINYSEFFLVIASDALKNTGDYYSRQIKHMKIAAMRNKKVIYADLTSRKNMVLKGISSKNVISRILVNSESETGIKATAEKIAGVVKQEEDRKELYEKLSAYAKMGVANKEAELICNLVDSICERIAFEQDATRKKEQFGELGRCLKKLSGKGALVGEETREKVAMALGKVKSIIGKEIMEESKRNPDAAKSMLEKFSEMSYAGKVGVAAATGGLLLGPIGLVGGAAIGSALVGGSMHGSALNKAGTVGEKPKDDIIEKEDKKPEKVMEEKKSDLFSSVASFMNEGNKILQLIGENDAAEDFFRCLLVSYQRLKKYCEVVGEKEIFGECVERIAELKKKLKGISPRNSATGGVAEIGIKSLLGFETTETENYDVFICHKSEDADIATGVYDFLHQNMLEPFFDKKTLTELAESEYRKAIMKALDKSTHFIVILSNLSYMETKWVSQEMETFMHEKTEGRKDGNFIMLVTDDVYDEITKANKSNIPIEYRSCEIMKVREYEDRLLGYVRK